MRKIYAINAYQKCVFSINENLKQVRSDLYYRFKVVFKGIFKFKIYTYFFFFRNAMYNKEVVADNF